MPSNDNLAGLDEQATSFARQLSDLVSAFVGFPLPFAATALGNKFSVKPETAIVVEVGDRKLLSLEVWYRCTYDHAGHYLVVDESSIKVFGGPKASGDPLVRYEYDRDSAADLPAAHVHVHAHRDHLVMAMALAGEAGAARRVATSDFMSGAHMARLHFPVGGHRFRPALEDVLQMLETEFGANTGPTWPAALKDARVTYRRSQVAASVRDCPSEAMRALEALGYRVTPPASGAAPDRHQQLEAF